MFVIVCSGHRLQCKPIELYQCFLIHCSSFQFSISISAGYSCLWGTLGACVSHYGVVVWGLGMEKDWLFSRVFTNRPSFLISGF